MLGANENSEVRATRQSAAGHHAGRRALGLGDDGLTKPKIVIVNSSSKLSSCFSHLDEVAAQVAQAACVSPVREGAVLRAPTQASG